jgi:hypothetical protein
MASQQTIKRCQQLWEKYDSKPSKAKLVTLTNQLEAMKASKSVRVKTERARCLRAVNEEWKAQGWVKPKPSAELDNPKPRKNARKKGLSRKEVAKWDQIGRSGGWDRGSTGWNETTGRATSLTYGPSSGSGLQLDIDFLYDEASLEDWRGDELITVEKYTRIAGEDDETFAKRVVIKAQATSDMYLGLD